MSLTIEFVIALIAFLSIPLYYYYSKIYRVKQFLDNFPTPPTTPLLGNARDFTSAAAFLKKLHEYTTKYGPLIHVQVGPFGHGLICSDYTFLEFLLGHNKLLSKSRNLKFLEPWVGKGLITADGGPKWKIHRKLITPAFHFKILEQFVDIFESDGNILVENLSKESGSKSLDIYPYITKCTLEAICETAMGTKVNFQNDETSSYFQSVKNMCRIFMMRSTSMILRYDVMFRFTKDYTIQKKSLEILHGYTEDVIKMKRKKLEKQSKENTYNVDDSGIKTKKVFLDLILEATNDNQSLTDEEIKEEVATFLFAGHDTTGTAITFILYCLANNKEVQDKVIEEQEQIFSGEKNPKVTYTNLQEMKYLENVIKEGLRLYSPIPFYGREINQDIEYSKVVKHLNRKIPASVIDGKIIPKGLNVLIFAHGIHMNPEYYPNPEKFDPSRFENMDNKHPFSFIPFSAGPRNCIGQKFAMTEMKSLISKIVRNFQLFPAIPYHELELAPETVLKSSNGVKIGLKLR